MKIIEDAKAKLRTEILSIEGRKDLTDDEKVSQICTIFGTTCAAIAVQPIPFADVFILTPIQGIMGKKIADIRGYSITDAGMKEVLIEIASLIGLGAASQQFALGLYKVGLPGLAGFTTIPLVFGITYGMGKAMDYYFKQKIKGEKIDKALFKDIYNKEKEKGKQKSKEQKEKIHVAESWFKNGAHNSGNIKRNDYKISAAKERADKLPIEHTVDGDVDRVYRENGQLESEEVWKDGILQVYREWYPNELLKREEIFKDDLTSIIRKWNEEGQQLVEWNYHKDDYLHGLQKKWHPNGQLMAEFLCKEDLKNGIYKEWYENGQLYRETYFVEGNQEGILKNWYPNGELKLEVSFIDGLINGIFRRWHENGQIKVDGFYINNKKERLFKQWDHNGKLKLETVYQNGEKISKKSF